MLPNTVSPNGLFAHLIFVTNEGKKMCNSQSYIEICLDNFKHRK